MAKAKKINKSDDETDKPKKMTVGELVMRQVENNEVEWEKVFPSDRQSTQFKAVHDALEKVRQVGEALNAHPQMWENFRRAAELQRQLIEPMRKFAEPMRKLNEHLEQLRLNGIGNFSLPPSFQPFTKLPDIELVNESEEDKISADPSYSLVAPIPSAIELSEQIDNLGTRLEQFIVDAIDKRFDNLTEQGKISIGKDVNIHCRPCGHLLMRVSDMSHFIKGTMKCGKCNKLLNLPDDLIIKVDKN